MFSLLFVTFKFSFFTTISIILASLTFIPSSYSFDICDINVKTQTIDRHGSKQLTISCDVDAQYEWCKFEHNGQFCELQWQGNTNKEEPVVMKDCKSLSSRVRVRSRNDYRCSIVLRYMVEQDYGKWKCEIESFGNGLKGSGIVKEKTIYFSDKGTCEENPTTLILAIIFSVIIFVGFVIFTVYFTWRRMIKKKKKKRNPNNPSFPKSQNASSIRKSISTIVPSLANDNFCMKNANKKDKEIEISADRNDLPKSHFSIDEESDVENGVKVESSYNMHTREVAIDCDFSGIALPKKCKRTRFDLNAQNYVIDKPGNSRMTDTINPTTTKVPSNSIVHDTISDQKCIKTYKMYQKSVNR